MSNGILAGIGGLTSVLLLIVLAVVVVLVASMNVTKSYESAKQERSKSLNDIRRFREERIALMRRVLGLFSDGNVHSENLTRLLEMNSKVDNEEKELLWEEKYVSVMKKFMNAARSDAPTKDVALTLSKSAVEENEEALAMARHAYAKSVTTMERYGTLPLSLFLHIGFAIQDVIMKKEADKRSSESEFDAGAIFEDDDLGL